MFSMDPLAFESWTIASRYQEEQKKLEEDFAENIFHILYKLKQKELKSILSTKPEPEPECCCPDIELLDKFIMLAVREEYDSRTHLPVATKLSDSKRIKRALITTIIVQLCLAGTLKVSRLENTERFRTIVELGISEEAAKLIHRNDTLLLEMLDVFIDHKRKGRRHTISHWIDELLAKKQMSKITSRCLSRGELKGYIAIIEEENFASFIFGKSKKYRIKDVTSRHHLVDMIRDVAYKNKQITNSTDFMLLTLVLYSYHLDSNILDNNFIFPETLNEQYSALGITKLDRRIHEHFVHLCREVMKAEQEKNLGLELETQSSNITSAG